MCPEPESNQRHEDFQSSALPTELSGHLGIFIPLALSVEQGVLLLELWAHFEVRHRLSYLGASIGTMSKRHFLNALADLKPAKIEYSVVKN